MSIFKECVTPTLDTQRYFCKSLSTGERRVNISGKREFGGQLACGLISRGYRISVFFIFGSFKSVCTTNENSNTTYFISMWSTPRHVLQTTPLHSTRPLPPYYIISTKCSSPRTPVTTILCLFYNVTHNIEVYPHSVNWTHTPISLQITKTPCSNIKNATDLAPSYS